jgi:hypothetical protein
MDRNTTASNNAQRSKEKRDGSPNIATSHRQDPTTTRYNSHMVGANIIDNHHHSQQPPPPPSNRRRLSYPTSIQHPSSSVAAAATARIQPLSVIPSKVNELTNVVNDRDTLGTDMNQNHHAHPKSTSHRHPTSRNVSTNQHIPPAPDRDHLHHYHHGMNTDHISTVPATVAASVSTTTVPSHALPKDDESQLYHFIVSLSESCRKHHHSAHSSGNDHVNDDHDRERTATFCFPLNNAPTYCQEAIRTLQQRILPHIETTLRNEINRCCTDPIQTTVKVLTSTKNSTVAPIQHPPPQLPSDIHSIRVMTLHMCDFYLDVLPQKSNSGFCPQSPHLLLYPQQSTYLCCMSCFL